MTNMTNYCFNCSMNRSGDIMYNPVVNLMQSTVSTQDC